jgi:Pyruvate/2-oxoacid:ferredoxin oxidoreductase gamma subunit
MKIDTRTSANMIMVGAFFAMSPEPEAGGR